MAIPFVTLSILFLLIIFGLIFVKKSKEKIESKEEVNEPYWWVIITFLIIVLVVVTGAIIIKELNKGAGSVTTEEDSSAIYPWFIFIPIWFGAARKKGRPSSKQRKILIGITIVTGVMVLMTLILWYLFS